VDVLNVVVNAVVIVAVGAALTYFMHDRFKMVERRIDRLEGRIDRFEDRSEQRFTGVERQAEALRSDLTLIALAVGVRREPGAS
jgi:hypothetical protein